VRGCVRCGVVLPRSQFPRTGRSVCRDCVETQAMARKQEADRRYYERHREQFRARYRRNRDRILARMAERRHGAAQARKVR
jgi:uncharacterized Zn finger protein (UPF0148 family)